MNGKREPVEEEEWLILWVRVTFLFFFLLIAVSSFHMHYFPHVSSINTLLEAFNTEKKTSRRIISPPQSLADQRRYIQSRRQKDKTSHGHGQDRTKRQREDSSSKIYQCF